jgi:2-oxoglutarate ferredoxin oxidoreductase subunit delta
MKKNNRVIIDQASCKGCRLCIITCPEKILELDESTVNSIGYNPAVCVDMSKCTACTLCGRICPDSVITIERGEK